jgi:hypothetical protein
MAKVHGRGSRYDKPATEGAVAAPEPPEEATAAEVPPEGLPEEKAPEKPVEPAPEGGIRVVCADAGAILSDANGKVLGPLPQNLLRPETPTLYWVDGPQSRRRQLVLRKDSPAELEVALRRVTRRAGSVSVPATDAAKAAAKKHADEVEAAIAAAEGNRGKPGFRKSPRQEIPDIKLTARQSVRARGLRWEQCAGFLYEMKVKFGAGAKKTRPEWATLWDAFKTRPVK